MCQKTKQNQVGQPILDGNDISEGRSLTPIANRSDSDQSQQGLSEDQESLFPPSLSFKKTSKREKEASSLVEDNQRDSCTMLPFQLMRRPTIPKLVRPFSFPIRNEKEEPGFKLEKVQEVDTIMVREPYFQHFRPVEKNVGKRALGKRFRPNNPSSLNVNKQKPPSGKPSPAKRVSLGLDYSKVSWDKLITTLFRTYSMLNSFRHEFDHRLIGLKLRGVGENELKNDSNMRQLAKKIYKYSQLQQAVMSGFYEKRNNAIRENKLDSVLEKIKAFKKTYREKFEEQRSAKWGRIGVGRMFGIDIYPASESSWYQQFKGGLKILGDAVGQRIKTFVKKLGQGVSYLVDKAGKITAIVVANVKLVGEQALALVKAGVEKAKAVVKMIKSLGSVAYKLIKLLGKSYIALFTKPKTFVKGLITSIKAGAGKFIRHLQKPTTNLLDLLGLSDFSPEYLFGNLLEKAGITIELIKERLKAGGERVDKVEAKAKEFIRRIQKFLITGDSSVLGTDDQMMEIRAGLRDHIAQIRSRILRGIKSFFIAKLGIAALKKVLGGPMALLAKLPSVLREISAVLKLFVSAFKLILKGRPIEAGQVIFNLIKQFLKRGAKVVLKTLFGIKLADFRVRVMKLKEKALRPLKRLKEKFSKKIEALKQRIEALKQKFSGKPNNKVWDATWKNFQLEEVKKEAHGPLRMGEEWDSLRSRINKHFFKQLQQRKWSLDVFKKLVSKVNSWKELYVFSTLFPSIGKKIARMRVKVYHLMRKHAKKTFKFKPLVTGSAKNMKRSLPIQNDLDVTITGKQQGGALVAMTKYAEVHFGKNWEKKLNSTLFTSHIIGDPAFYKAYFGKDDKLSEALEKRNRMVREIIWRKLRGSYQQSLGGMEQEQEGKGNLAFSKLLGDHKNIKNTARGQHKKSKIADPQSFSGKPDNPIKLNLVAMIDRYYDGLSSDRKSEKNRSAKKLLSLDRAANTGNEESYISWGSRKYELVLRPIIENRNALQKKLKKLRGKRNWFQRLITKLSLKRVKVQLDQFALRKEEAYDYAAENLNFALRKFKPQTFGQEKGALTAVLQSAKYFNRAIISKTVTKDEIHEKRGLKGRVKIFAYLAQKIKESKTYDAVKFVLKKLYPRKLNPAISWSERARKFFAEGLVLGEETLASLNSGSRPISMETLSKQTLFEVNGGSTEKGSKRQKRKRSVDPGRSQRNKPIDAPNISNWPFRQDDNGLPHFVNHHVSGGRGTQHNSKSIFGGSDINDKTGIEILKRQIKSAFSNSGNPKLLKTRRAAETGDVFKDFIVTSSIGDILLRLNITKKEIDTAFPQ